MLVTLKKLVTVSVLAICLLGCASSVTSKEESHIEILWREFVLGYGDLRKFKDGNIICYQAYRDGIWCYEDKERE